MNYHLILTRRCNLNCEYCHGGEETGEDAEIQYTLDQLESFLSQDDDVQLMMYGGEPTLRIQHMTQIMNRFPDARYMLQTNGLLLDKIPTQLIHRFHSILVSIDGRREVTDAYRSEGVYDRVLKNVKWLVETGFNGDIVARMAVSEKSDIYDEVRHLLNLSSPIFKHVHWQLNVVWDAEGNWHDFDGWLNNSYYPGISRLVDDWIAAMKTGVVEGIVPFLPLMHSLISAEDSELRCGSGLDTFAIHVDGSIGICPISPDWEFSIVGNIKESSPRDLRNVMRVDEPCPSCEIYGVCGGRCLFANKQRLWGEEGFTKICDSVKQLVASLQKQVPTVKQLIEEGTISIKDLEYPEFNNGCEIIP